MAMVTMVLSGLPALSASLVAQPSDDFSPRYTLHSTADGLGDNHVQHVMQLPDGRMAVTTWGGINLYDGSQYVRPLRTEQSVAHIAEHKGSFQVMLDSDERLWVKRWQQLWCYDLRQGRYVEQFDSLFAQLRPSGSGQVRNLFVDSRRHLWLLCADGLWDVNAQRLVRLPQIEGSLCGVEFRAGRLWVFTAAGHWIVLEEPSLRVLTSSKQPAVADADKFWEVKMLTAGPDSVFYQLYCGRSSRVVAIHPATGNASILFEAQRLINCLAVSATAGELWMGSRQCIFVRHHDESIDTLRHFAASNGWQTGTPDVSTIYLDGNNGLWIGINGQGLLYRHECPYSMRSAASPSDLGVPEELEHQFRVRRQPMYFDVANQTSNDTLTDRHGRHWQATSTGLRMAMPQQYGAVRSRMLTTADGLASNYVVSMAEDRRGRLWVATGKGISCITVGADAAHILITNYDTSDGCLSTEYLARSAQCLPDGRIAMQGINGWTAFHPDSVQKPLMPLVPRLVSIGVNGHEWPTAERLHLHHDQNSVDLHFSAFHYSHPQHTYYRWRLCHDRDTTWHAASHFTTPSLVDANGSLHLVMMKLPPGNYRLEVAASTDGHSFVGQVASLAICISPPWWRTWWARLLFFGLLATIIVGYLCRERRHRKRLESANGQLQKAANSIAALNQMKTRFIQNMSHEIRTPLNKILGFAQVVAMEAEDKPEVKECTDIMIREGKNLLAIVDDALLLSDIESRPLTLAEVRLASLCDTAVSATRHKSQPGVSVDMGISSNCRVWGDAQLLQAVVTNVLDNALKFTAEGSVSISSSTVGDSVVLSIADTGPGIPALEAEHVFERFVKLDSFVSGTGLGLSVCREIVNRHHGTIVIDIHYTQGCKVDITLPRSPQSAPTVTKPIKL